MLTGIEVAAGKTRELELVMEVGAVVEGTVVTAEGAVDLDAELVRRLACCGAGILAKPFTLDGLDDAFRSQIARN